MLHEKIGLGTVQFGTSYGIANKIGQTPPAEVTRILDKAYELGIRTIDTASAYGKSEEVLGRNRMERFSVVSKFMPATASQSVSQQLEQTLSHLQVSTLYGYLAHRPASLLEDTSQWKELESLKMQGRVQKIGYSLNDPGELESLLKLEMVPDLVQTPYNYLDQRFRQSLIELKNAGCEIHTRSAFLQGLFFLDTAALSPFFDEVKPIIGEAQKTYGDSLPAVLLKYVLSRDFIDRVIMGVETEQQLISNLASINEAETIKDILPNISASILNPSCWPKK